jgi:hypothetical protein
MSTNRNTICWLLMEFEKPASSDTKSRRRNNTDTHGQRHNVNIQHTAYYSILQHSTAYSIHIYSSYSARSLEASKVGNELGTIPNGSSFILFGPSIDFRLERAVSTASIQKMSFHFIRHDCILEMFYFINSHFVYGTNTRYEYDVIIQKKSAKYKIVSIAHISPHHTL